MGEMEETVMERVMVSDRSYENRKFYGETIMEEIF